jgi:hypothetical protein
VLSFGSSFVIDVNAEAEASGSELAAMDTTELEGMLIMFGEVAETHNFTLVHSPIIIYSLKGIYRQRKKANEVHFRQ